MTDAEIRNEYILRAGTTNGLRVSPCDADGGRALKPDSTITATRRLLLGSVIESTASKMKLTGG